jgi:hypothetical protein
MMIRLLATTLGLGLLVACSSVSSGYQNSYRASEEIDDKGQIARLAEGESPTIRMSEDLNADLESLRAEGYVVLGFSQFTGPAEGTEGIQALARKNGATLVLNSSLSEGRKIKYRKEYERYGGSVLIPVPADPDGDENSEPQTSQGYATEEFFRQTALFLARKR